MPVHEHPEDEVEEMGEFALQAPIERLRIFEGTPHEDIPEGFDALTIYLEGSLQADLNWQKARDLASTAIERGYRVLWDLDLGLFSKMTQPLTNQGQFLSLALSVEHFRDSLWKEFKDKTIGVSLFRGAADFSYGFPWDLHQEDSLKSWLSEKCTIDGMNLAQARQTAAGKQLVRLFCRDVAMEYLSLLASRLPDTLTTYLFLDASSFAGSLAEEMQYMNPERFDRFHLALKNSRLPMEALGWGVPSSFGYSGVVSKEIPEVLPVQIAVCVPPMEDDWRQPDPGFLEALLELKRLSLPFKLIAENRLTSQWDGLDELFYSPSGLSIQGRRKLQGFCAAGGTAVSTGELTGLPEERSFRDWLKKR